MLSKSKIKIIQSIGRKKSRQEHDLFLVEGNKMTKEVLMSDFTIETLICTKEFRIQNIDLLHKVKEFIEVEKSDINKVSLLQNPQDSLAIVKQFKNEEPSFDFNKNLYLALDCIQDPGNLGTILRIADWFGISGIICSENTADIFNPKVVQASMGAIFRTKVWYTNLAEFFMRINSSEIQIYGTYMDGNNIYNEQLTNNGIIVFGNEGKGISENIEKHVKTRLSIPSFNKAEQNSESLNVAIAAAICCSEFKRR